MDPSLPRNNDIHHPQWWGEAGPGMRWHHVIPYSLLRDVWNRLVRQQIETELPAAKRTIRRYLVLLDPALSTDRTVGLDKLINRMRAENTEKAINSRHHHLEPLNREETDRLREAAAWPMWNAVAGWRAQIRSDDPGGVYYERFRAGLTEMEILRMRAIRELFDQLQTFVRPSAVDENTLHALNRAMSNAQPFVRWCNEPIHYRPEMWVRDDETGLYRKRYLHEAQTVFVKLIKTRSETSRNRDL